MMDGGVAIWQKRVNRKPDPTIKRVIGKSHQQEYIQYGVAVEIN